MRLFLARTLLVSSLLLTGVLPVAADPSVEKPGTQVADAIPETWSTRGQLAGYLSTRRNGKDTDLYIVDPRDPNSDRLIAECNGGGLASDESSSDRSRTVVIERPANDRAGVEVDPSPPNVRRWTTRDADEPDPSDLEPGRVGTASLDGLAISGVLYRPDLARFGGRRPLVFYIHDDPRGPSYRGFQGRNTCRLNELGIAILHPADRGSIPSARP